MKTPSTKKSLFQKIKLKKNKDKSTQWVPEQKMSAITKDLHEAANQMKKDEADLELTKQQAILFNHSIKDKIYEVKDFNITCNRKELLKNINIDIANRKITTLIGPSGAGKSSFLKSLNRLITEVLYKPTITGKILFNNQNIFDKSTNVYNLRKHVGMVFQKPTPFEMSIFDNVAYAPRIHGIKNKKKVTEIVKRALHDAALYDEVYTHLKDSALSLSGGQQQRLCIARALSIEPEVLLLDEPTSALDPVATVKIENLVRKLKKEYTIVFVTHSLAQASRCSDNTAFFYKGEIIKYCTTKELLINPDSKIIENFIAKTEG